MKPEHFTVKSVINMQQLYSILLRLLSQKIFIEEKNNILNAKLGNAGHEEGIHLGEEASILQGTMHTQSRNHSHLVAI